MATIKLSNEDARLTYLALQYHLARPGSELNQATPGSEPGGLSEATAALEPQLKSGVAMIELNGAQQRRLLSAISGAITELKATPLQDALGRGTMPAFTDALRRLFPGVSKDPEAVVALSGRMLQLRRRVEGQSVVDKTNGSSTDRSPLWQFWKRS